LRGRSQPSAKIRQYGWYEYLYQKIGTTKKEFLQSHLSVITFNYDRSFEYFLYLALTNTYGPKDKDIEQLLEAIPVVHIYGMLGAPSWISEPMSRPYEPTVNYAAIETCIKCIKIMHEGEGTSDEINEAQRLIKDAEVICFLGFGYHKENLARLGIPSLLGSTHPLTKCYGSAFNVATMDREPVSNAFKGNIILGAEPEDVLRYLQVNVPLTRGN
jgi:hypothetical protein